MAKKRKTRAQKERASQRRIVRQPAVASEPPKSSNNRLATDTKKMPVEPKQLEIVAEDARTHRRRMRAMRLSLLVLLSLVAIQLGLWLLTRVGWIQLDFVNF